MGQSQSLLENIVQGTNCTPLSPLPVTGEKPCPFTAEDCHMLTLLALQSTAKRWTACANAS